MTEALFPFLENNPTLISAILIPLLAWTIGQTAARTGSVSEREKLESPTSRPGAIARYRIGRWPAYFESIERLTTWAGGFYGPRYSWKSYVRCLQIALLYPLVALLLGWAIFDAGDVGGFPMLDEGRSRFDRLWRLGVLLAGWAVAYWIVANADRFSDWSVDRVDKYLRCTTPGASFLSKVAPGVVRFVAGAFAFAVAFAGAVAVTGAVGVAFAVAFAVAVAVTGAVGVAFAVAVAVAFAGAFAGDFEAVTVWTLFFILLPILNAAADWLSVGVTRSFLAHIARRGSETQKPGLALILWDVFLDLVAAALCLTGLIITIILALEAWAAIAPSMLLFDWRTYWQGIQTSPSHGTALYLMCFTTLIPTIIHVIAGFGAVFTHRSRLMHRAADMLEANSATMDLNIEADALRLLFRARLWGYGISALIVLGILAILFALIRAAL